MTQLIVEKFLQKNKGRWFTAKQISNELKITNASPILKRMTTHPHYNDKIKTEYTTITSPIGNHYMCRIYTWIGDSEKNESR